MNVLDLSAPCTPAGAQHTFECATHGGLLTAEDGELCATVRRFASEAEARTARPALTAVASDDATDYATVEDPARLFVPETLYHGHEIIRQLERWHAAHAHRGDLAPAEGCGP